MDLAEVKDLIRRFAERHRHTFAEISSRQYQLLELGSLIAVQQHYAANGFETKIESPDDLPAFIVKKNSRGHPSKYSRISLARDDIEVELHLNLLVNGAHDNGIYCVDIGIVEAGVVPPRPPKSTRWRCIANEDLVSFAEVKRLRVYPMLLAQFLGEVHEIKPAFLAPPLMEGFGREHHLPPTLIVLGHFSGNSSTIVKAYPGRGVQVHVAESFDLRVAAYRVQRCRSPLFWHEDLEGADKETMIEDVSPKDTSVHTAPTSAGNVTP